jgi:formylglycine-generating enzyme required for sulfatase activity
VTYDLYEMFMYESKDPDPKPDAISRPSPPYIDFTRGMGKQGGFPANSMSQYAALTFCKWLYQKTGVFYRLPTEAEWEFACRAGSTTAYPFGKKSKLLKDYAWFDKNSGNKYHKVGELKPNAWGLYDMLGNVAEWTLDEYRPDYLSTIAPLSENPVTTPASRHPRTLKGGCFSDNAYKMRPAARLKSNLDWNRRDPQLPKSKWWNTDAPFIGFRLLRPYPAPDAQEIEQFFQTQLVQIK